jgi:hypothetical protein
MMYGAKSIIEMLDLDLSYTEFFAGSKLSIIYAANLVTEVLESELSCTEMFAGGFKLAQKLRLPSQSQTRVELNDPLFEIRATLLRLISRWN